MARVCFLETMLFCSRLCIGHSFLSLVLCYLDVCLAQRWHDFFPGVSSDLISESLGVCHCGQYPSNVFGRSRKLADARGVKLADDQLCYSVLTEDASFP